jgi:hypothetical protein
MIFQKFQKASNSKDLFPATEIFKQHKARAVIEKTLPGLHL